MAIRRTQANRSQTNRTQTSRRRQAVGHTTGKRCACQSALGTLRGYLSFPTPEAAGGAPPCLRCGRTPLEAARGFPVKLNVELDAETV